jgi:hypothetical protein
VTLTFVFALFFHWLAGEPVAGYFDVLAEGVSGGAFLATVAGTMLPRTAQDGLLYSSLSLSLPPRLPCNLRIYF